MSIWFNKKPTFDSIIIPGQKTMATVLGIEWISIGNDFIEAKMPVDHRTIQPYGLLHGGASCALAETMGSVASALVIDHTRFLSVGIEINANHVRSAREGYVYGKVTPLHLGSTTHVWDIRITDEQQKLVCVSRLTVAIIKRRDQ